MVKIASGAKALGKAGCIRNHDQRSRPLDIMWPAWCIAFNDRLNLQEVSQEYRLASHPQKHDRNMMRNISKETQVKS